MFTRVIHSFDSDDAGALCAARVSEMLSLLSGSVDSATREAIGAGVRNPQGLPAADFAGLRAAAKISGNAFETADVDAVLSYVAVLTQRHRVTADAALRAGSDPRLARGILETAEIAERMADDFKTAFDEYLDALRLPEDSVPRRG